MNIAGAIVVILGGFLVVVALRGTQAQIFPWFFSDATPAPAAPNPPIVPGVGNPPDKNGNCDPGTINIAGICMSVGPVFTT